MIELLASAHVEKGNLTTPDGTPYVGFKVTIGGIVDEEDVQRTYDDINKIFKANPGSYKVEEHHDANGHFHSFSVIT